MKTLPWLCLCLFSHLTVADPRSEFLDMIQAAEAGCTTPAKYTDLYLEGDDNHAQLYCLSAFAFECTGEHEKALLNCATVANRSDISKCPVCNKTTAHPKE